MLTSHALDEAEGLCDRLGIFEGGRLRCLGSPQVRTTTSPHFSPYYMHSDSAPRHLVPIACTATAHLTIRSLACTAQCTIVLYLIAHLESTPLWLSRKNGPHSLNMNMKKVVSLHTAYCLSFIALTNNGFHPLARTWPSPSGLLPDAGPDRALQPCPALQPGGTPGPPGG